MKKLFFIAALAGFIACKNKDNNETDKPDPNAPKLMSYSIVATYPHDTSSFTEGLLFYKDKMYESTGLEEKSKLMEVDLKTGKAIRSTNLDKKYFGEGMVIINDTVYQMTYTTKIGFMYSLKDLKKIGEFKYDAAQGWGMTTDGKNIIATHGTSDINFYEPGTFKLLKTQAVTESGGPAVSINELEYIDGYIYANQWQYPYILKIDLNTGIVVAKADLTKIIERIRSIYPKADVLNGIAYDPSTKKIYITGKNWPELYEVQFSQ
ncbi:MAG: glutaminyl-peptide cyclotransferase [Bacteroidota bacterium]|nr:glutaminyl-peptide cyclotransferase [Bacteroidota bacterium]